MKNNDFSEFNCLVSEYPHLEEKAIVDFINGLTVMSDHLDVKGKIASKGHSARFFDRLIGDSYRRQELIDNSVESSFLFIKDYVISNEQRLAKNEHFLHQVMSGVSMISARLMEVVNDTQGLRKNLNELTNKIARMEQSISQRIDNLELHDSAMTEMNLALNVFKSGSAMLTPEQRLWMLLTQLKYGDFGLWIVSQSGGSKHRQTVQRVMESLKMECVRILSVQTQRTPHELVDRKTLFASLSADDEMLKDALCLVSDHDSNELESVIIRVNSGGEPKPGSEMPFVFSNTSIYVEMSRLLTPRKQHVAIH